MSTAVRSSVSAAAERAAAQQHFAERLPRGGDIEMLRGSDCANIGERLRGRLSSARTRSPAFKYRLASASR